MSTLGTQRDPLLDAIVIVNRLRALPEGGLALRAEFARPLPAAEGAADHDRDRLQRPFDDEAIGPVTWDVWMKKATHVA